MSNACDKNKGDHNKGISIATKIFSTMVPPVSHLVCVNLSLALKVLTKGDLSHLLLNIHTPANRCHSYAQSTGIILYLDIIGLGTCGGTVLFETGGSWEMESFVLGC